MNRSWYVSGFVIVLFGIIAFQLIWLPAPYFFGKDPEWIEYINGLYYAVLLIPCCWLIGAIVRSVQNLQPRIGLLLLRIVTMLGSIGLIIFLLRPLEHLLTVIILLTITVISIIIELIWCKAIVVQENDSIHSVQLKHNYSSLIYPIVGYIVVLLLLICPTGFKVTYPAMTMNMNSYAHIGQYDGGNGIIDGVLVFERPAFPVDWLYRAMFPAYTIEKNAENEPSIKETYSQVTTMKNDANQLAAAVAWERAGLGEAVVFDGVQVVAIMANSPADGKLKADDIIKAIDKTELENAQGLIDYLSDHVKVGQQVSLDVIRDKNHFKLNIVTNESRTGNNKAALGISVQNAYTTKINEELTFEKYIAHFGGPSHGAMLTLAFLDQLTEGDITGGLKVAGTGTIEPDGSVGMVGGIEQKAYAVSRTDADVFFVPRGGMLEATMAAPDLKIVPVTSIFDILYWLKMHDDNEELTQI